MSQRRARNQRGTAFTVGIFEGNLFGPQSKWSSLLRQREHLQNEIVRGRRHLGQLRKDLAECEALVQTWPCAEHVSGGSGRRNGRAAIPANDSAEQFLSGWLIHLEEQLAAVVAELEALDQVPAVEPLFPEESMFALLRAAG